MTNKTLKQEGFTLLELMIGVIILMTLITVAIPKYQDYLVQTKYMSAVNQLSADKNTVINRAIQNGFNFSSIPDEELDPQGMQTHFSLGDNSNQKYLDGIGGKKESDYDFMLYQFVDKEDIKAPEIAPEMIAMAVVIEEGGAISYHCHYYHSTYEWDYDGGDKYTSLQCDSSTSRLSDTSENTSTGSSDDNNGSDIPDSSSTPETGTDDETDTTENSGPQTNTGTKTDDTSSSSGSSSSSGAASGSDSDNSNNNGEKPCDHGEKVKGNNGHGNNDDGVDSSNPGQGNNKKEDASCTGNKCVDDEKGRKK